MHKSFIDRFFEATGSQPENDDLERSFCDKAGEIGHYQCGWCSDCNKPRFICGHLLINPFSKK